jgi:phosphatidylglycerol:prolipoprotein diacylglycerol transferase
MAEVLSFPGLGLEFEINRIAMTVAGRPIYWYGVIIALAFLAAASFVLMRAKAFGLDGDRVMDVVLGSVLVGIVGARVYYVIFRWDSYTEDLMRVFYIWEGGIAIYGGIIGGVLAAVFICKWRRVKLLPMLDLAAGGVLLGQAIGRWGNFVNIEVFGGNTTLPWGMTSRTISWYLNENLQDLRAIGMTVDPDLPVHPTFLYESLWCLIGFIMLARFAQKRKFDGEMGLFYLVWYGLGRFFIEGLRTDSLLLGTMRVSQVLALLCVLVAGVALVTIRSRITRANDPDYMRLYITTDEAAAVLDGTFYKKKEEKPEEIAEETTDETADDAQEETEASEDVAEPETEPETELETESTPDENTENNPDKV